MGLNMFDISILRWLTHIRAQSMSIAACVTPLLFLFKAFTVFTPNFSLNLKHTDKLADLKTQLNIQRKVNRNRNSIIFVLFFFFYIHYKNRSGVGYTKNSLLQRWLVVSRAFQPSFRKEFIVYLAQCVYCESGRETPSYASNESFRITNSGSFASQGTRNKQ